jgi:hypothetical protein
MNPIHSIAGKSAEILVLSQFHDYCAQATSVTVSQLFQFSSQDFGNRKGMNK